MVWVLNGEASCGVARQSRIGSERLVGVRRATLGGLRYGSFGSDRCVVACQGLAVLERCGKSSSGLYWTGEVGQGSLGPYWR